MSQLDETQSTARSLTEGSQADGSSLSGSNFGGANDAGNGGGGGGGGGRRGGRRGPNPLLVPRQRDQTAEKLQAAFENFIEEFTVAAGFPIYLRQIEGMKLQDKTTIYVDYEHINQFSETLASAIVEEYYRFEPFLRKAVQNVVRRHHPEFVTSMATVNIGGINTNIFREFWIAFYGLPGVSRVRELRTNKIGQLISIIGTVTRVSEIRPELTHGRFQCNVCSTYAPEVEQQFKFTEPTMCINPSCQNRTQWTLNVDVSRFADWQRVRIQENSSEIPAGSMPRSIDVILRNEIVDKAKPGDKCRFTGSLIVVPDVSQLSSLGSKVETARGQDGPRASNAEGISGLKSLGVRELTYKMSFLACMAQPSEVRSGVNIRDDDANETPEKILEQFTADQLHSIERMRNDAQVYNKLASSIAPNIHGHDEVKRGVLLLLFGGVHKKTASEGINLRGDINLCIVGDPSTSKSQFLKYVSGFLPRSVYTSGKASSAAGLTASVVKDEETGEFTIEAGALMLADNGICAIDEFDKMDIADQVAIHEAMEQQTISIAKAGIQATLNARTSILAAANPVNGRYDKTKSLKYNVNMSAPIMSRFDLFFVVLDEIDRTSDFLIARHILNVHAQRDEARMPEYSTQEMQQYIRYARTLKPKMTVESARLLVEQYVKIRQSDAVGSRKAAYRITVRQLESMIRLSEALARVHCDPEIKPKYVREAHRLLTKSIINVETEKIALEDENELDEANAMETDEQKEAIAGKKKVIPVDYETYTRITNVLVSYIRSLDSDQNGVKRSEIINWYLEAIEDDISDEESLIREQKMIRSIIHHLVHKDQILLEIRSDVTDEAAKDDEDPLIIVHPNYNVEL